MKTAYRVLKVLVFMMAAGFGLSLLSLHHKNSSLTISPSRKSHSFKTSQGHAPIRTSQRIVSSGEGRAVSLPEDAGGRFSEEALYFDQKALAYLEEGRLEEAERILSDRLAADPGDFRAHLGMGILQHERGDNEAAMRELREVLHLDPHNVDAKFHLAEIVAFDMEEEAAPSELARAERYYQEIQDELPDRFDVQNGLATLYDLTNRTEEAIWIWESMAKEGSANSSVYTNLSNAYLGAYRIEQAAESAQTAIEADPKNADAYFLLGLAERNLGNQDSSAEAFRKATELEPANPIYLQIIEGPHSK